MAQSKKAKALAAAVNPEHLYALDEALKMG